MDKKIYLIGIGGIGISAIARYYLQEGYQVFGSDKTNSELIKKLISEGIDIIIGEDENRINNDFELIVYTEAIPNKQKELIKSKQLGLKLLTYPQALANIANNKKLITIAGTHGKSTTTSITSLILKNSNKNFTSIVGTLLKEFEGKNFFYRSDNNINNENYFIIEACEYKRSFLFYKPYIGIITNIEIDHLDYYKDLEDYISAYKDYLDNIKIGGTAIINGHDKNCQRLNGLRKDIKYIEVYNDYYIQNGQQKHYPNIDIKIPGNHILFDAKISYIIGKIIGLEDDIILKSLSVYNGAWRRMEPIGLTVNNNLLLSDYGHHPTEISLTLEAIKNNNMDKKILTIFQPHQYNRTLELLDGFIDSFKNTDILIIPNIYESRDSNEDIEKINSEKLVGLINHTNKYDGKGFENTLKLIEKFDKQYSNNLIIILMGAGNIDDLRYKIKTTI